jgi:hypothetical protein
LYTDIEGFVWAGLYGEGALRINTRTGKVTYFNKELRNGNILNISGSGQTVWLATLGDVQKLPFKASNTPSGTIAVRMGWFLILITRYIRMGPGCGSLVMAKA